MTAPEKTEFQKYCHECGAIIPRGADLCPKCGIRQPSLEAGTSGGTKLLFGCLIAIAVTIAAVVVIGILAAIAIPKFANTKEKAYIAAIKTDLRNLATAEEGYFADHKRYTGHLDSLTAFQLSPNVTATLAADSVGWSATAKHSSAAISCTIGVGTKVEQGFADGQVHCR